MLAVPASLVDVNVGGSAEPWTALGFTVADGRVATRNGAVAFGTPVGFDVGGPDIPADATLDGVPLRHVGTPVGLAPAHRNHSFELDHVVIVTPRLEATSKHVEAVLGMRRLRRRETSKVTQAFHRFADPDRADGGVRGCILELVENTDVAAPALWGVVFTTSDLDAMHADYPDLVGEPRVAVQDGRRIATIGKAAGLPTAVAMMSPHPVS